MQCELCGKDTELFTAMVEGIQLRVCAGCGRFGKVFRKIQPPAATKAARVKSEPVQVESVVSDYSNKIRAAREKRGLTQIDFAKLITVKESLIHKMETGHFEPPIDMARKMERILRITLVEVRQEEGVVKQEKEEKTEGLTIGDILKLNH
jgi:putative transcription factor